ncbi:MAG TPA: hypothetical protein DCP31_03385, partial [Cyanobacteria bacterium UBA8543]|nr:hypothetical protein [Cyanobacteria bacterium UBA8543]
MEQGQLTENDIALWHKFRKAEMDFFAVRWELLSSCTDKKSVIKQAFNNPSDRSSALELLLYLDIKERLPFFDDLVSLASVNHSDIELVWKVILSLPKDFLLANIEKSAETVLSNATQDAYVEYRCLLELYFKIDPHLTYRLAQRALQ